jgi:hypothetical protein
LVNRLAQRFRATDGDIRAVLKALFDSPEFRASVGGKYKTPYQFVLSAVRAAAVPIENTRPLLGAMARLGMPLYHCATPDGYKNTAAAWLNADATTLRINFATALARGNLPIASPPPALPQPQLVADSPQPAVAPPKGDPVDPARLEAVLGPGLSLDAREAVAAAPPGLRAALILGSPDFMRR